MIMDILTKPNTAKAYDYASRCHYGQFRADGITPYFTHPCRVADYALALGHKDDRIIAACLLHDVVEDCDVTYDDLPVDDEVKEVVRYLTIEYPAPKPSFELKQEIKSKYFKNLINNKNALIIKGIDRYLNLYDMINIFPKSRIIKNVRETKEMLLPVIHDGMKKYKEDIYIDSLYILNINLTSMISAMEV